MKTTILIASLIVTGFVCFCLGQVYGEKQRQNLIEQRYILIEGVDDDKFYDHSDIELILFGEVQL